MNVRKRGSFKRRLGRFGLLSAAVCVVIGNFPCAGFGANAKPAPSEPESFVRIERDGSGFYFVQDGKPFLSLGINTIQTHDVREAEPDRKYNVLPKYRGDAHAWAADVHDRLTNWNFNTAAAWCTEELYERPVHHVRVVYFGHYGKVAGSGDNRLLDVFSEAYAKEVETTAQRDVTPHKDNKWLLGWCINNELHWYGEVGWATPHEKSLLERYWVLPREAAGRQRAAEFVKGWYGSFDQFAEDWLTTATNWASWEEEPMLRGKGLSAERVKYAWAGVVADHYFALSTAALRRADPNHLILGCRFSGVAPMAVVEASARYCDAVSIHIYRRSTVPDYGLFRNLFALTGRPIMLTEFSWRGMENRSGNRNTSGGDSTLSTQKDRGDAYAAFVPALMAEPYMIGAHWFQYFDQPGGEVGYGGDSNYGVVDTADRPYEELVDAMRVANAQVQRERTRREWKRFTFDPIAWNELLDVGVTADPAFGQVQVFPPGPFERHPRPTVVADFRKGGWGAWTVDERGWVFRFGSGRGWGVQAQVTLDRNELTGAGQIELDIEPSRPLKVQIFLDETGDDYPHVAEYLGRHGADGESFQSVGFTLAGPRERVTLPMKELIIRRWWGNQNGDRTIETAGLRALSLCIEGGQGDGEVIVHGIRFTPADPEILTIKAEVEDGWREVESASPEQDVRPFRTKIEGKRRVAR